MIYGFKGFPNDLIEHSSFNQYRNNNNNNREEINIVIFDKVIGYLNWYHDDFVKASYDSCSTKCKITNRRDRVRVWVDGVYAMCMYI